jgi:hypothetical protein
MATRSLKYLTIGLRRDKNLSDVQDSTQALNSLLNNLFSTSEPGTSFISEDLDAIRGLQNTNLTVQKLSALSDTTVQASKIELDPVTGGLIVVEEIVTPIVRLKDRLENAYLITSENPAIRGGKGLNCRFIESTEINTGSRASTGSDIFDFNSDQKEEIFWAAGYFNFSTTIDPTFRNQYGGLQWTGWFSPSLRDPDVNIAINSTGLFIFEVDLKEDGDWQTLASVYASSRSVEVANTASEATTIELSPGEGKYVSEGDYWGAYDEGGSNVIVNSISGDTIVLDTPVSVVAGQDVNVIKILGETNTRSIVTLPSVAVGNFLKIRISAWWPDNDEDIFNKTIEFDYIGSSLSFSYMYNVKPNPTPQPLEIRQFLEDIVTPSQNFIGETVNYKNFYVNNPALINFSPVSGFSQVLKHGPVNLTVTDYNEVIRFASSVSNALVGDVIVPTTTGTFINTLPDRRLVIKDDISAAVRVANQQPGTNITLPVYIVNNKGFVNWIYGTVSGNSVTIVEGDADLLRKDYIVIAPATAPSSWIRITAIDKIANTFTTNVSLGTGTILILVYTDKSLIDASKDIVCEGVIGQELQSTVSSGDQITLKTVDGVVLGQVVQYAGADPVNPIIPNGSTVTDITGNIVTISSAITGEIRQDSTIVFAPAGTTINVEGCVIPLNTAPPFVGTVAGLSTSGLGIRTVASNPTLAVTVNDLKLDLPTEDITLALTSNTFNRKVQVILGSSSYSILAKNA